MNIAIITAGGVGTRMKLSIPKQLYEVNGKPLIVYTLERFQKCRLVDAICLVYLEEYKSEFLKLINAFSLTKVKWLVPGGETNQMSIFSGLQHLKAANVANNDIIIVHDGIRPLVSEQVIGDAISVCEEKGNAIAVVPCNEAMLKSNNGYSSRISIDRSTVWKTQTPHCMRFADMISLVKETLNKGINNSVAICTMLIENGKEVFFSKGDNMNFKLTTPEDIELFKGVLEAKEYNNHE